MNPIAVFLGSALVVRLLGLNAAALWFDEAISKYRAQLPMPAYLADMGDYTGANLWEIMLRPFAWGPVWLLRLPALAAAMLALWFAWRLMDRLEFTRAQRITAAVPLALLPGLVWMAQDARYYAPIAALYMAGLYWAVGRQWLGALACAAVIAYIHPVAGVYGATVLIVALVAGAQILRAFSLGTLALIAWAPRIWSLLAPHEGRPEFWLRETSAPYVLEQTAQAFAVDTLGAGAALVLLGLLAVALILGLARLRELPVRVTLAAAVLPILFLLAGAIIQPVYFYRPAQPAVMAWALLFGATIGATRGAGRVILWAIGAACLVAAVANWNPAARGGYIDQGAAFIERNWHPGDRITYAAVTVAVPFRYYIPNHASCLIADNGLDRLPRNMDLKYCEPGAVGPWLVWPREEIMAPALLRRLETITAGRVPVWRSDAAWQSAPIEIYYLEGIE